MLLENSLSYDCELEWAFNGFGFEQAWPLRHSLPHGAATTATTTLAGRELTEEFIEALQQLFLHARGEQIGPHLEDQPQHKGRRSSRVLRKLMRSTGR